MVDWIKKHRRTLFGVFIVAILTGGIISLGRAGLYQAVIWRLKIRQVAESGTPFEMKDMFTFKWDVLYILHEPYSDGRELKEKYGLDFDIPAGVNDSQVRLLFFNDDKLVKVLRLDNFKNNFDLSLEEIFPNTILIAEQKDGVDFVYNIHKQK